MSAAATPDTRRAVREKDRENRVVKKSRGRPSKLTPDLVDRLVALVADGASVSAAAADVGVTLRTVQAWRARAFSRDPRDAAHVAFERRLQAARVDAARRSSATPAADDWQIAAAQLESIAPERWLLPEPPDVA